MAIIGSAVTIIEGVRYIINTVSVTKNSYRRDWTRYVNIMQDPNNWVWYWAGRTVWSTVVSMV